MDTKSLAKSKRAHSQHHSKKHHPKPTPKTPSAGAATSSQNTNVKQVKDKVQGGSKQLPSNWDRYEHESDSDSNVPPQGSISQPSDVSLPKSKGSDYAYLIYEAQSRAQSSYDTGSLLSFDDVFTDFNQEVGSLLGVRDFNQEVGSLLGVRGQSILSWAADDDFLSESKASGSQEASFLSMDLNALAEQLAKVDISERLYIEADLLPPELRTGELQTSHKQEPCKGEVPHKSETNIEVSSELSNIANQCDWEIEISGTTSFDHPVKTEVSGSTSIPNDSFIPESKSQFNAESDSVQNKSQSIFKATDAEAELDMLLDSFCEPNIPQSSVLKGDPRYSINEAQGDTSTTISVEISSAQLVSSPFKNGVDVSKSASTLDDSLDDLLKETSNQINQDVRSQSSNVKTVAPSVLPSSSSDTTQSKLLEDFDSWLDTI